MYDLKPSTIQLLDSFQYFDWFSSIGKPIKADVIQPRSLEEAFRYSESHEWDSAWNEKGNQLTHCVRRSLGEEEFKQWNKKARALHELYKPIQVPEHVITRSKRFQVNLKSTYLGLGLEAEYADVCFGDLSPEMRMLYDSYLECYPIYQQPKPFAATIAYWYMCGHFPCGWIGNYPRGKWVVY